MKRGRIKWKVPIKNFLTTEVPRPWDRWLGTEERLPSRGLLTVGVIPSGEPSGLMS